MDSRLKELSNYRLEKAEQNIEIAESLAADKIYGVALNRAYYAVFDAMRAVHALEKFDTSKHSGVISHFNEYYVKTGKFDPKVSKVIKRASMLRERSDYEDFYVPQKDEVDETIKDVKAFIIDVKSYLSKID